MVPRVVVGGTESSGGGMKQRSPPSQGYKCTVIIFVASDDARGTILEMRRCGKAPCIRRVFGKLV